MNGEKRYHAEVKLTIEGHEARINCFADTLIEIFEDVGTICAQFPQDWKSPAKREIANAELKAKQLKKEGGDGPTGNFGFTPEGNVVHAPACVHCGSSDNMELISFKDKKNGQPRQAWKCQECKEWHYPEKK